MAKSQKRSSKEIRKPKTKKAPASEAATTKIKGTLEPISSKKKG